MCTKKPFKSNRFCSFLLKLPFHVWPLVDLWSDNYGARILILDTPDSQSPVWAAHLGRVSAEWRGSGHQWPGPPLSLRVTGHQSQHSLASRKIDLAETRKILETYLYLIYHWKNRLHWIQWHYADVVNIIIYCMRHGLLRDREPSDRVIITLDTSDSQSPVSEWEHAEDASGGRDQAVVMWNIMTCHVTR